MKQIKNVAYPLTRIDSNRFVSARELKPRSFLHVYLLFYVWSLPLAVSFAVSRIYSPLSQRWQCPSGLRVFHDSDFGSKREHSLNRTERNKSQISRIRREGKKLEAKGFQVKRTGWWMRTNTRMGKKTNENVSKLMGKK